VAETLQSLANIHGIDPADMAAATSENYRILFAP
jgi:Tat protein secretion system quality control protein TatD with DNase activity